MVDHSGKMDLAQLIVTLYWSRRYNLGVSARHLAPLPTQVLKKLFWKVTWFYSMAFIVLFAFAILEFPKHGVQPTQLKRPSSPLTVFLPLSMTLRSHHYTAIWTPARINTSGSEEISLQKIASLISPIL